MSDDQYSKIRTTSSLPEFRGTDLEVYGPYDSDEEVVVPYHNADVLVNRDKAEWIEKEVDTDE